MKTCLSATGTDLRMLQKLKNWFAPSLKGEALQDQLAKLRQRTPVPVFWLFGRTQSGKTSLIKYLTGAEEAEIGQGFRPCTRFSRKYEFPTPETPLLTFLDTRGLDEPGYDAAEDLSAFDTQAHAVVVTVKVLDYALERVITHLRRVRASQPGRPVVLVPTCLHEAYPQQQHPQPYPFNTEAGAARVRPDAAVPDELRRSLEEQERRFAGLVDHVVPVDLTPPEEGFEEPNYGGGPLKQVLLRALPAAFRQTLVSLGSATRELQDLYARAALPHIVGYSSLAATAGAVPIPMLDLMTLPAIQTRMISELAKLYGQPLTATRFLEMASALGMGLLMRQAVRQLTKFIPIVGSVAGGALAGASTFALGKAFCYYYSAVHKGHIPKPEDLRRYYEEQLAQAERMWLGTKPAKPKEELPA